ncbi:MAG TPA: 5'/3'-nucleotidase SurE [Candidatus Deferrimicrobium sp.]|nr:5'/3'-nucleotidase SurE [Candidatus Deferrimicrobium sp.]
MSATRKARRIRILLTNDDGIFANGINAVGAALAATYDVTVVAPEGNQSGSSHSLTLGDILPIREVTMPCGLKGFALRGTPTDCVLVALLDVMKDNPPDIVISGCNHGPNVGVDVLYSGTVSAALEGLRQGHPSIAVSLDMVHGVEPHHFETAAAVLMEILAEPAFYADLVKAPAILNVNVPNVPLSDVKGVMITKQGFRAYENFVEKQFSPRGRAYYWIAGNSGPHDAKPGSDGYALISDYVSVTPINLDLTCDELLKPLEARKGLVEKRLAVVTGARGTFGRSATPAVGARRSVKAPVVATSPNSALKAPSAPTRVASHYTGSGSEAKAASATGVRKRLKR